MLFRITAYYGQAFKFCIETSAETLEAASDHAALTFKRATMLIVEAI